jgi:hypothetical protein
VWQSGDGGQTWAALPGAPGGVISLAGPLPDGRFFVALAE